MGLEHDVRLVVGRDQLETSSWDAYEVHLDMLNPGSGWMFSFWRSSQWDDIQDRTRIGDQVVVTIDGAAQLVGVVEDQHIVPDRGQGARYVVSGRDYAGPAISAGAAPTLVLRNVTLQDALTRLFAPLGLQVVFGAQVDAVRLAPGVRAQRFRQTPRAQRRELIDRFRPRLGEKIWQTADSICRRMGYLLWTAPGDGTRGVTLRVDVPSTAAPTFMLERREDASGAVPAGDVLDAELMLHGRDVPSSVTVYAETAQGDSQSARIAREVTNSFLLDETLTFGRVSPQRPPQPHYQLGDRARTITAARQEATRVMVDAAAGFTVYQAEHTGHGQMVGGQRVLFAPNLVARVTDTLCRLDAAPFLITATTFKGSRAHGKTTSLRLIPRGILLLDPTNT
jgi:prophage tail gpP-like protein